MLFFKYREYGKGIQKKKIIEIFVTKIGVTLWLLYGLYYIWIIFYMYYIKIINVQAKTTCFIQEQKGEIIKVENILYDIICIYLL